MLDYVLHAAITFMTRSLLFSVFFLAEQLTSEIYPACGSRWSHPSLSKPDMGPERFTENPEPILASDVWSLGASIYELAEGELPFSGMGGGMMLKGAKIPLLSSGWSKNLNDMMRWCLEKETWNRAKACQVQKIAETVLQAEHTVAVAELILQLKENEQSASLPKDKTKRDPRATNPQVNVGTAENDAYNGNDIYSENYVSITEWWKKPVTWTIAAVTVLLLFGVLWYFSSNDDPQSGKLQPTIETKTSFIEETDAAAEKEQDSVGIKSPANENTSAHDIRPKNELTPLQKQIVKPIPTEAESSVGTLNLGYATWNGSIRGGKPDGKGTMTFMASHRIDSRDPNGRVAEVGDRIEGTYIKGHLDEGRWYKSDGTTEYIMLGE